MDLPTIKKELKRRGFTKPPYNVCVVLNPDDPTQQRNIQAHYEQMKQPLEESPKAKLEHLNDSVADGSHSIKIAIQKENANDGGHIAFRKADDPKKTDLTLSQDLGAIIAATVGEGAEHDFKDGVPKVSKLSEKEGKGLLKLIGHDPRFKNGQPIVQPAYFQRSCQNWYCCVLFWLYWIGMLVVMGVAVTTGDPYRLIRPIDYNGNTCGSETSLGKEEMYYPQLAMDAVKMYQDSEYASTCADSVSGCFYGICTDGCPKKGSYLCNYEVQAGIEESCSGPPSGYDTVAACVLANQEANNNNGCWVVQMNSIEIFKRCLPWESGTTETQYSCDVTYTAATGQSVVTSTPIRSDNCPCGGPDMLECTDDNAKQPGTQTCLAQMWDPTKCDGTSDEPATCEGTFSDSNGLTGLSCEAPTCKEAATTSVPADRDACDAVEDLDDDTACGHVKKTSTCTETATTSNSVDRAACAAVVDLDDDTACGLVVKDGTVGEPACTYTDLSTEAACTYTALMCQCADVREFLVDPASSNCPDECTFTPTPTCDLDESTDSRGDCPEGCTKTALADPDTTCTLDQAGEFDDDDILQVEGTCTAQAGSSADGFCTYHVESKQENCTTGVMDMKLTLGCPHGVIHRTQITEAEYTEGTEDMSSALTTYSAWLNQAGSDVYNASELIIIMGPVLSAVTAFCFILFMSYFAGVLIWTTLIALQIIFIVATLFMSWQCGYLQSLLDGIINTTSTETGNSTWSAVAGDGATTAQAWLEGYSAFGETDEEATESNEIIWMIAFWVSLILTVVYFCALLALRKQIKLAIELVKEAGRTVRKMPLALFYPMFTYAMLFVMFLYFFFVATYIITSDADIDSLSETYSLENATFDLDTLTDVAAQAQAELAANDTIVAYNATAAETNNLIRGLFVYHLFGYYWVAEFIKAIGMLTIAGAICSDYWITDDKLRPSSPVVQSFYRSIRYHAGSAVYGALVIAIIRLWRAIMMYIDKQTQELQRANRAAAILMKVIHCCLWCLEKIARYISNAAFIMIAIEGRGFCLSAWRSFKLLFSNSLRIATTESIALLIIWLANVGITACCVMLTMLCLNNLPMYTCIGLESGETCDSYVDNALVPSIFVGITSFMIAYCFMQVYGMAITTILLSFCLDEDKFKNGAYTEKLNEEGEKDGRMFCVIREKIGLIELVSPSIAKQQEALEEEQKRFQVEQAKAALLARP